MQIVKQNTVKPVVTKLFIGEFVGKKSRKVKIVTINEQDLTKVKTWIEEKLSSIEVNTKINVLDKPKSTGYVMMRNQQGSKVIGKSVSLTTYYVDLATMYKAITGDDLQTEEVKEIEEQPKTEEIDMTAKQNAENKSKATKKSTTKKSEKVS